MEGTPGARTAEELETLLEDAFVLRDQEAVGRLFEPGAVLVAGTGLEEARGCSAIVRAAGKVLAEDRTYTADTSRVIQAGDLALVVGTGSISVARRGHDQCWRYLIACKRFELAVASRGSQGTP